MGGKYGGVQACVVFVEAVPGEGPKLHRHPYVELLIVVEAGRPHAFINSGEEPLRQIDIHLSPRFITDGSLSRPAMQTSYLNSHPVGATVSGSSGGSCVREGDTCTGGDLV